ncbi:MAG: T9SS type A sorting domain-containing protein [Bacteroidota bacterium]
MKKIIFTLYVLTSFALISMAQDCVPDFTVTSPGVYPNTYTANCFTQGTDGELVITVKNFSTAGPGGAFTVDSVFIDSVTNIPCGLKYSVYPNNRRLLTGEAGCIRIHGISSDPDGQYPIKIYAKIYGTPDIPGFEGVSASLDFLGTLNTPPLDFRYWVRVKGSGTCATLDTSIASTANLTATCKGTDNTSVNDIITDYSNLNIAPNPVKNSMIVTFDSDNNNDIVYTITSISGQTVKTSTYNGVSGSNTIEIDAANLNPGTYFIRLQNGKSSITKKFVKE